MIHHATLAKAQKLGIVMTENDTQFLGHWPERNKRGYAALGAGNAAALLDDMRVLKMLTLEYSHLKVEQPHVKDGNYVWEISLRGDVIGEGATLAAAFDEAADVLGSTEGDTDEVGDVEGDEPAEGKSVVRRKYKTKYRLFKMTCGDDISQLITAHVTVKDDAGKHIDKAKLVKFAKQNGAWNDRYAHLNVGMIRMNVANVIRAKVRKTGYEIIWN